jgi:hypothetical protein
VRFRVDKKHLDQNNKNRFHFPLYGYMHIKGEQVKYRATIIGILPFLPSHYESKEAEQFKPKVWIREWEECKKVRELQWKYTLVINKITKLKVLAA